MSTALNDMIDGIPYMWTIMDPNFCSCCTQNGRNNMLIRVG